MRYRRGDILDAPRGLEGMERNKTVAILHLLCLHPLLSKEMLSVQPENLVAMGVMQVVLPQTFRESSEPHLSSRLRRRIPAYTLLNRKLVTRANTPSHRHFDQ